MKGFYITVSNGLLEPKHVKRMGGGAVFLYMWFLDHMTSVSEEGVGLVLGGQPITHDMVTLGISQRTYRRWLEVLAKEPEPYILLTRAPHGYIVEVFKAKKIFKQKTDRTELTHDKDKSDGTKTPSDWTKVSKSSARSGPSHRTKVSHVYRQDSRQDKDKTIDNAQQVLSQEQVKAIGFMNWWNQTFGTKFSNADPLVKNLAYWMTKYSEREIALASVAAKKDKFWSKVMTPEKLLRRKNPNHEEVDRIAEFLNPAAVQQDKLFSKMVW